MKKLTNEKFIEKSKEIHGNKYDYSLVEYKNNRTKVKIICPKHGIFEQLPKAHLNKQGCPICNKNILTDNEFINKLKSIYSDKYDYSLVNYKNIRTKVKIICPKHGIFEITPNHLNHTDICYKCKNENLFIKKSKEVHGDKYDYSLVNYINSHIKVKIICPIHGIFEQLPYHHINQKCGCPICNESKGELEIRKILDKYKIKYESQKTFENCKYLKSLKFDFYLPNYNCCIEYDGQQHFESNEFFGGDQEYNNIINRDKIKNEYCKQNKIKLIRIKYNENINFKILTILNIFQFVF